MSVDATIGVFVLCSSASVFVVIESVCGFASSAIHGK